jgi:serine/threonine protein kinase
VLATYEDSTEVHLVTELCDTPLLAYLAQRCPSGQVDEAVVRQVVGQLLAGVAVLHHHGIVHRDLKPDNLMVNLPQRKGDPCQVHNRSSLRHTRSSTQTEQRFVGCESDE